MEISSEKESNIFLEVNSCGRQYLCDRDWNALRPKGRIDYHVLYIAKGYCYVEFDGSEYQVTPGHIILFRPGERQKYCFYQRDNSVSCYIHFSGTECCNLLEKFGMSTQHIYHVGTQHNLEKIIIEMENEFILQHPFSKDNCSAYLLQFLATAGRLIGCHQNSINSKHSKNIEDVCKYMHHNYHEKHPIQYYAQMCHLSESRFSHAFKECTGYTPKAYLMSQKINVAKRLLDDTDMSLSEIAEITGFEDSTYLSRMFKKVIGFSPKHYRQFS